ncbi:alternate-type signal peptide domain-containing protein [Arthrobacter sp. HLT1-20]
MKKVMKAAIAAGAAGALMLGGAGTFALWNATDDIDAGAVSTGHLKLDTTTSPGVWNDISVPATPVVFDAANEKIVPGDTLEFKQTVTIQADGKNLQGALTVGQLAALPGGLLNEADVVLDVDHVAAGLSKHPTTGVLSFAAPGTYNIPVTITVTFPKGDLAGDLTPAATMDQTINFSSLTLTLNQVRA